MDNSKKPLTTTSIIRVWVKKYDELFDLRCLVAKRFNGRFPCCGPLLEEESKEFFQVLKTSESLREKLKGEGRDYVALIFDNVRHELSL